MITERERQQQLRRQLVRTLQTLGIEKVTLAGKLAGVAAMIDQVIRAIEEIDAGEVIEATEEVLQRMTKPRMRFGRAGCKAA